MAKRKPQPSWMCVITLLLAAISQVVAARVPYLRVLTLGDSITKGSGSSDKNGYRKPLRDKLVSFVSDGDSAVDMIGTLKDGNMADSDHEGHSGEYLKTISGYWQKPAKARPNVVCIHAGTNNMDKEVDLDIAPTLMKDMVLGIMKAAPEAVVLIAPVIWANDARMQANTDKFNNELRSMIKTMQDDKRHVLEVPIDITLGDLSDKKHPNNQGYQKMANAWFEAIKDASNRGWLKDPIDMDSNDLPDVGLGTDSESSSSPNPGGHGVFGCQGGNWEKKGTVFDSFRAWEETGTIRSAVPKGTRDGVILADLNNDGITDYIMADSDGTVRAWINEGIGKPNQWTSLSEINPA